MGNSVGYIVGVLAAMAVALGLAGTLRGPAAARMLALFFFGGIMGAVFTSIKTAALSKQEVRSMSEIQGIARLKIHEGKLGEFKRLAAECFELARAKDKGTLQYELYFNSDNTECFVLERYRDSQALLDHARNLGETSAVLFQTCSREAVLCGTPSPELLAFLKGSGVEVFTPFLADKWISF